MKKILPPKALPVNRVRLFVAALVTPLFITAVYLGATAHIKNGRLVFNLPTVSYTSPHIYNVGTPIADLTPTTTDGRAMGFFGSVQTFTSNVNHPEGVAADNAGNIYVADFSNNAVTEFPADGSAVKTIASGFAPSAVAVGNGSLVFVCDYINNQVIKLTANGSTSMIFASGFSGPQGVAVDRGGNVYVANGGNKVISIFKADGTLVRSITGFNHPSGIAVDYAGNMYVADSGDNHVYKIIAGSNTLVPVASVAKAYSVAVNTHGDVYYTTGAGIDMNTNDTTQPVQYHLTFDPTHLAGIAVDNTGKVYAAADLSSTINEIVPTGGYYIDQPLPSGLTFNSGTGVISGTPSAVYNGNVFHVTSYNASGSAQAAVSIQTVLPAPPAITYTTPQVLQLGQSFSLTPTSSGVLPFGFGAPVNYSVGVASLGNPIGITMDTEGNAYVCDASLASLLRIPAGGGTASMVGSGFLSPSAAAIDAAGNIYVADYGHHLIKEILAHTGQINSIDANLAGPSAIAVDAQGNIYVADNVNNNIKRIAPGGGSFTIVATSISSIGIALNANGDLFMTDRNTNNVYKLLKGETTLTVASSGYSDPAGITVDAAGNVYVADYGHNAIQMFRPGNGTLIVIKSLLNGPVGITTDADGNIYFAEQTSHLIKKLTPTGGYFITRPLPAGLSFDRTTGVISGTPTAITPAQYDTVRVYNAFNSAQAIINLQVRLYAPATIQYAGPQTYKASIAIAPLTPTSTGVNAPAYGVPTVFAQGFGATGGVAAAAGGNVYVGDHAGAGIRAFTTDGANPVTSYQGSFPNPTKIATDPSGAYFAGYNAGVNSLSRTGGGGVQQVVSNVTVTGLAMDSKATMYYTDAIHGQVFKMLLANTTPVVVAANIGATGGLAVDGAGNVYVGDYSTTSILKIPADGSGPITFASNIAGPAGLAVDNAGNVYEADDVALTVRKITPSGQITLVGSGWGMPVNITIDGAGNIYVADKTANCIKLVAPTGGYYIYPALQTGLNFDTATGTISGVPANAFDLDYRIVTGWNLGGSTVDTVFFKSVLPPAPAISYRKSQTLTVGANVGIIPVSSNVGAQGYNNAPATINSGYTNPEGVAVDSKGNLYVAVPNENAIIETPADGSAPKTLILGPGAIGPIAVAVDADGNIYAADVDDSSVRMLPKNGGAPVVLATGFQAWGVAVNKAGDVFVTDVTYGKIKKLAKGTTGFVDFITSMAHPRGISTDAAGNIYAVDPISHVVNKYLPDGTYAATVASALNNPVDVKVDAENSVYVVDQGNHSIKKYASTIDVNQNVVYGSQIIGSGFTQPAGIAIDSTGKVYVTELSDNSLRVIVPSGGYFISPSLPPGLVMDNNTGIISGVPTTTTPVTKFTITAYNAVGSSTAVTTIRTTATPASISYNTPVVLPLGTPANQPATRSGVDAFAYSQTAGIISGSEITKPAGVITDAAGNVYVVDIYTPYVIEYPADGSKPVHIGSGLITPCDIATNNDGFLYVIDRGGTAAAKKINIGTGAVTILPGTFYNPNGIAVDPLGNVYVTDLTSQLITKIPLSGTPVTIGSGWVGPYGIKFDPYGNMYVSEYGKPSIKMVPAGSTTPVLIGSGLNLATGLTVDASGNVFVCDYSRSKLFMFPADNSAPVVIASGLAGPNGVAVDPKGQLYLADYTNGFVRIVKPVGGAFLNKFLPKGLTFNNNTGTIAGTPVVTTPRTDYFVTAYNATDSASTKVNIKTGSLSSISTLSALATSTGTLSPVFASTTTAYQVAVANVTSTIKITPVATDADATIKVNGTTVVSGVASASLPLSTGSNTITTVVTAPDGSVTKTYTITVTRAASNLSANAVLSAIKATPTSSLTVVTGADYKDYTTTVPVTETSVKITPTAQDATATIKVNGVTVASGSASASIPLNAGTTVIKIAVTAQDGVTVKTYGITFTRPGTVNADLSAFKISSGTLSPAFAAATTSYAATVANATASIAVTPTIAASGETVKVNGVTVASGTASGAIALAVGPNVITTVVTAADGTTTKTYTLTVSRTGSANSVLSTLKVTPATPLTVVTGADYKDYTTTVPNSETTVKITPTSQDATATIKVNGVTVASGTASASIPLNVGTTVIKSVVTAQDGVTVKTYSITFTRPGTANANLSAFKLTGGTFSPVFAAGSTSYTATVPNATTSITVTPTAAEAGETIKVHGVAVASGITSDFIELAVGTNVIATVVTSSDGTTTKTYTLTVTRAASNNAVLSIFKLTPATTLATVTGSDYRDYTTTVPNSETTVKITPTAQDATATIKVNGVTVASGTASASIPLTVGDNVINTVVTAQDGVTKKTYSLKITRAPAPMVQAYEAPDTLKAANDGITVHPGLSPNGDGISDVLIIDGITNYPDNTFQVINRSGALVYSVKGYDNASKVFDGTSNINGKLQQPGTYFYRLEYTAEGKAKFKTGFIVIKY